MSGAPADTAYHAALEYLYSLRTFGTRLGIERMRALLDALGSPDARLTFLHLAGTNGKGSTAAMLAAILRAAGLRVGLYTSPHLVEFTERIQVNAEPITPADAHALLQRVRACAESLPGEHATFFEVVTAMAACHFAERACDVVVWETGLGGRLDATNAVHACASAITTVARDHCQWLGESLAQIAAEKAGIIKPHTPVFTTATHPEVLPVIAQHAHERAAPLTLVCEDHEPVTPGPPARIIRYSGVPLGAARYAVDVPALCVARAELALRGAHQIGNAALAATLADWYLAYTGCTVRTAAIVGGLVQARWPGRLEVLSEAPLMLLDCAHNPNGMDALAGALAEFGPQPWTLVMGVMSDKELAPMLQALPAMVRSIWYVPPSNERRMAPDAFQDAVRAVRPELAAGAVYADAAAALAAMRAAAPEQRFVIAGSCYLAGDILAAWRHMRRDPRADDPLRGCQARN